MRTATSQVPFWTFFGATVIGKALIKMHAQMLLEVCAAHLVRSFFFAYVWLCWLCLPVFGCVWLRTTSGVLGLSCDLLGFESIVSPFPPFPSPPAAPIATVAPTIDKPQPRLSSSFGHCRDPHPKFRLRPNPHSYLSTCLSRCTFWAPRTCTRPWCSWKMSLLPARGSGGRWRRMCRPPSTGRSAGMASKRRCGHPDGGCGIPTLGVQSN